MKSKIVKRSALLLALMLFFAASASSLQIFASPAVPWSSAAIMIPDNGNGESRDLIQDAFDKSAELGVEVVFAANATYYISKTLTIPDNAVIYGNGATILIDSNRIEQWEYAKVNSSQNAIYREFCIINEGFVTRSMTTFSMDGLHLISRDDHNTKNISHTLFGLGFAENVSITNCEFSVYSAVRRSMSPFDAYTRWKNLSISGCTFNVMHDGPMGSVGIRNFAGVEACQGAVIDNCVFNNKSADEALMIWGTYPSSVAQPCIVRDVTVRNSKFYNFTSQYNNNPAHLIALGNTGHTDNILFENNYIHMEAVFNSVIKIKENTTNGKDNSVDNIFVRNNTIVVDDVAQTANQVITGDDVQRTCVVEGNSITLNTKSGLLKNGVTGRYTVFKNNQFYGNGFNYVFFYVRAAQGNTIEQCNNGFYGVLECKDNTIFECKGNFLFITSHNYTPDANRYQDIVVEGNSFSSANRAVFYISTETRYCNLVLKNNVINGGRIWSNASTASTCSLELHGNTFLISSLDEIVFGSGVGGISTIAGNWFRDPGGNPLISSSQWPAGNSFNRCVAVGVVLAIEEIAVDRTAADPVVAYQKTAQGTGQATWRPVRASEKLV